MESSKRAWFLTSACVNEYRPIILRESRHPRVIPKLRSLAFSKPGTTAFSAATETAACGAGTEICAGGIWAQCTAPEPSEEVCDGQDNDCDNQIDENLGQTTCGLGACTQAYLMGIWGMTSETLLIFYLYLTSFFLLYVPFSKISHYIYWPFIRFYIGKHFGHRGVYPPKAVPRHG